jgi:hypothetical protein
MCRGTAWPCKPGAEGSTPSSSTSRRRSMKDVHSPGTREARVRFPQAAPSPGRRYTSARNGERGASRAQVAGPTSARWRAGSVGPKRLDGLIAQRIEHAATDRGMGVRIPLSPPTTSPPAESGGRPPKAARASSTLAGDTPAPAEPAVGFLNRLQRGSTPRAGTIASVPTGSGARILIWTVRVRLPPGALDKRIGRVHPSGQLMR